MEEETLLSLYDVLINHGDFDKLLQAIDASEGIRTLLKEEEGPFTFFAPTDDAFDEFEEQLATKNMSLIGVLANEEIIGKILSHHLTEGSISGDKAITMNGKKLTFMDGQQCEIKVDNDVVKLDNATVVEADIEASNGVIHSLSSVIIPDGLDF